MKNLKLLFGSAVVFSALFAQIGFAQNPSFENKVWASDCSKQFPSRAWIRSGKELNNYLLLEPTRFSKLKVGNVSVKEGAISFSYENTDVNETYVFEKNNLVLKTRVIDGVVLAENGVFLKTKNSAPTLYSCEQDSIAATAFAKKVEEAKLAQQSDSCLVLAESVEKYQIDTCNPEKIQQLITARVETHFVNTLQFVNGNQLISNIVIGDRGQFGGNRVEKTITSYKRTGKLMMWILTPQTSPDCQLTQEVIEETNTTLVLKYKSIKGNSCTSLALRIANDNIASGRQSRYVKINN